MSARYFIVHFHVPSPCETPLAFGPFESVATMRAEIADWRGDGAVREVVESDTEPDVEHFHGSLEPREKWLRVRMRDGSTAAYGPWLGHDLRSRAYDSWRSDPAVAAVTLHDAKPDADHHHRPIEQKPRRDLGRKHAMKRPARRPVQAVRPSIPSSPQGFMWRGKWRSA